MRKGAKNPLTHGAYAQEVVLPWEDAEDFERLHEELRRDLKPSGYLQERTVWEITIEYWRKQRLVIAHALQFHKKQMTPELMEAAKGGVAGLAAFLADRPNHSGAEAMTLEKMLDVCRMLKDRGWTFTIPKEDEDSNKLEPDKTPKKNCITSEIVEQAYDLVRLEKYLKLETMIDNRIRNLMARFFALQSCVGMYDHKLMKAVPQLEAPPINPADALAPEAGVITESDGSANNQEGNKGRCD